MKHAVHRLSRYLGYTARHGPVPSQVVCVGVQEPEEHVQRSVHSMHAATMEDDWFARNMPGNIRTAEPAPNDAVPQFPLDALYTQQQQQHNNTNNRSTGFDIQQLMRLNQGGPSSPAPVQTDSPTQMLLRLLGLIPQNPAAGDLPANLPGVLDTNPAFKRPGLTVDSVDFNNGQLQNIQELLRSQPNGLQAPQAQTSGMQVSAAEVAFLQQAGGNLEMSNCVLPRREGCKACSEFLFFVQGT